MKNFHMDLIRVTEAGAIAASQWVGRGDKEAADKAATDAMRDRLNKIDCCMEVAIGEGEKDESHGLFEGELVGAFGGREPNGKYSLAVDPIEGTTPTAKGGYEAISVIAMGEENALYKSEFFYMEKIAVGPQIVSYFDDLIKEHMLPISGLPIGLNQSAEENVQLVAKALGKSPQHVTVCVLDRPRTDPLVKELKKIGCRIKFISDCDVTGCIATCIDDSGIDMFWSIGGAPESVITACAMKSMGGFLQCREVEKDWTPSGDLLEIEDLAQGEVMFAATGITDGQLLKGVRYTRGGPITHSMAMRSGSGTIRKLVTEHGN